ncbi:hypothetical protein [Galactobacillus timonensis]|uniref:hypothetical protein n=2 Tax=Galactobacillus timonensis TaxID=2041840 RepID=UPI000C823004|nr:hypothetical protein [Galactobacillus timonensis]
MGMFDAKSTVSIVTNVELLGVVNKVVDTKLHAVLNFAEYVQGDEYSFFVSTENGSRRITTCDPHEVDVLTRAANAFKKDKELLKNQNGLSDGTAQIINQLSQLTDLLEKNVISKAKYEELAGPLLNSLNGPKQSARKIPANNFYVYEVDHATSKMMSAVILPVIDGKKYKKSSVGANTYGAFSLPIGEHTFQAKMGAFTSLEWNFNIENEYEQIVIVVEHDTNKGQTLNLFVERHK